MYADHEVERLLSEYLCLSTTNQSRYEKEKDNEETIASNEEKTVTTLKHNKQQIMIESRGGREVISRGSFSSSTDINNKIVQ